MNSSSQQALFVEGMRLATEIKGNDVKLASPGSGMYLLFGPVPSTQSINIKFGRAFERFFEEAVSLGTNNFILMPSGVWEEINKDLDLIFRDDENKIIYYRELKLNLNLDTEKIVATYEKINYITDFLIKKYPDYEINSALLTWSTFNLDDITAQSQVKKADNYYVSVEDPETFFELVGMPMNKDNYEEFFRSIGALFKGDS